MPIKSILRILIVEPDFTLADAITITLIKEGYFVDLALTSTEAVEIAVSTPPQILLIEPHIQWEMQGVNVANTILAISPTTEVIFLSNKQEQEIRRVLLKEPCLFLSKPFEDAHLIKAVEKCFSGGKNADNKLFY